MWETEIFGWGNEIKHKIVEVKKYIVAQCTKMTEDRKRKLQI